MRRFYRWGIRTFYVVAILSCLSLSARAQTGYFWQSPTGGSGTWKTGVLNWGSSSAGAQDHTWLSDGSERANFSTTGGVVTIDAGGVTTNGINFNTNGYTITGPGALNWFAGNVNIGAGNTGTISAAITGGGTTGFNKIGLGSVILSGANTFSNGLSISAGGTLVGIAQASGSPFSSGTVLLDTSVLRLDGIAANTTTTVSDFTAAGASLTSIGTEQLIIDNSAGIGGGSVTTLAAGNLLRGGAGGALVVTAQNNTLGSGENVTFSNGNSLLTNGILPAWIVESTGSLDFVGYGGNGLQTATYTSTDITGSGSLDVVAQSVTATAGGALTAYALKTNAAINLSGNTLTLGNNSGQTGLILNSGGSVTGGNIDFGTSEGMIYFQPGAGAIGSNGNTITGNALTFVMAGAGAGTINSNIVNGSGATSVILSAPTLGSTFAINGANTYTGGTTLSINANNSGSAGTLLIGNDSAFGTGTVTTVIGTAGTSPNLVAVGGPRTLANAFNLGGGLNFVGTNGFVFTGPISLINSGRTLLSNVTGGSIVLGSAGSPSTITLGNTGDGIGRTLTLTANVAGAQIVLNDTLVDPSPNALGQVTYSGPSGGTIQVNSVSSYTGTTTFNGGNSAIQFNQDSTGSSGPFGVGTMLANNTTNNFLQPIGTAGTARTLSNPFVLNFGFTVNSATGSTTGLTLTGPIMLLGAGRTIQDNLAAGATLTLGSSGSPSTFTLPTVNSTNTQLNGSGALIVNDLIRDASGVTAGSSQLTIGNTSNVWFTNPNNNYTGTTNFSGAGTIIPISISSNALPGAGFTSGPFGVGTFQPNNGTNQHLVPIGGNQFISNVISMSTGFAMDNISGDTSNLTFAGQIFEAAAGKFISNGFNGTGANTPLSGGVGGTMIIGDANAPSTITLPTGGGTLNVAAICGTITINDLIQNGGSAGVVAINPNAGDSATVTLNNSNTYTGGTTLGGSGLNAGGFIQIGTDSVGSPGSLTAGPFGTGAILMNSTNSSSTSIPNLIPLGADRTVGNAITMTSGFFVSNNATPHSLNLTGPITLGATSRVLTNNMAGSATLSLGSGGSQNLTLGSNLVIQSQNVGGGITSINDKVTSTGSLTVQVGGVVYLNNPANDYAGGTSVTGGRLVANNGGSGSATGSGAVTVTGSGAVGSGGTLGGTGTITGPITISSTTGGSQGGVIAPGNSPGTIHVGSMAWDPNGRYAFDYNASDTTTGSGINDHISGTGALDLTQLSNTAGSQFDLNLTPIGGTATPGQTYVIATFAGGVTVPGVITGNDLSSLFTISGTFGPNTTPIVTLAGNSIDVTFDAVPEPGCLMLLGAAAGLFGVRRPRRRRAA